MAIDSDNSNTSLRNNKICCMTAMKQLSKLLISVNMRTLEPHLFVWLQLTRESLKNSHSRNHIRTLLAIYSSA